MTTDGLTATWSRKGWSETEAWIASRHTTQWTTQWTVLRLLPRGLDAGLRSQVAHAVIKIKGGCGGGLPEDVTSTLIAAYEAGRREGKVG